MINFRKIVCKSCHKGSFWYGLFDCRRYESPAPPVPPIPPKPPDPPKPPQGVPGPPWIGPSYYLLNEVDDLKQTWFIREIAVNGGNCTEVFLVKNWGDWRKQPYELIEEHFQDPPHVIPLWDLDKWNDIFWDDLVDTFISMQAYNIRPFIRILDFCSVKGEAKRKFCFRSNRQRLIDHNLSGGLWGVPIRADYAKLIEKLILTLEDAGWKRNEPFYSLWNEADVLEPEKFPGGDKGADKALYDQYVWWINFMVGMGVPRNHLIVNVSRKQVEDDLSQEYPDVIFEWHGCASPKRMDLYFGNAHEWIPPITCFPNGDGPDPYAEGRAGDKPDRREPSVGQATQMNPMLFGRFGYCYFNRATEQVSPPNIMRAQFDVLRALGGKE